MLMQYRAKTKNSYLIDTLSHYLKSPEHGLGINMGKHLNYP